MTQQKPPEEKTSKPDALKVLVVDDDREITLGLGVRLEAAGFEVATAHDGNEGVIAALGCQPDAIIMDIRMPNKDGIAALQELRSRQETAKIPVIMLSASIRDQQRALEEGASFFVQKPYDPQTVLSAINASITESPVA